jgi:hypothetical protein
MKKTIRTAKKIKNWRKTLSGLSEKNFAMHTKRYASCTLFYDSEYAKCLNNVS